MSTQNYDIKRSDTTCKSTEVVESCNNYNLAIPLHSLTLGAGRTVKHGRTERSPFAEKDLNLLACASFALPPKPQSSLDCTTNPSSPAFTDRTYETVTLQASRACFQLPYCQPSSTSHEAHNVLKEHMNTRFLEHSLQQYQVADFLQSCQYILERLNHLTGPARLSQKFLGYEAADIIKLSESFTLKKGNTSTTGSA